MTKIVLDTQVIVSKQLFPKILDLFGAQWRHFDQHFMSIVDNFLKNHKKRTENFYISLLDKKFSIFGVVATYWSHVPVTYQAVVYQAVT